MSEFLTPLVAASGNSHFARSMRVKLQWRDRFGRWIEMGKGVKFKFRRPDGSVVSAKGTYVGATDDPNMGQVYVSKDPNGLKDGFYSINSANAQEILASIDPTYLQQRGIQLGQHDDGTQVTDRLDEAIPNQQDVPYSAAPIGWKVSGGSQQDSSQATEWTTDDGDYVVRPATFPVRQRTGNTLMLYKGAPGGAGRQQPVGGGFKDWSSTLEEVNREDASSPATNADAPDPNDPWGSDPNANAPEVPDATTDANLSPKDRAKAAISQYDQDGTISNLIDENGKSDDILNALDNSPEWKDANDDYTNRDAVDAPQQIQKDKWAAHEQQINAIKALDSADDTTANPDTATGSNLDLSVGDVAADGYLIPTEGNLENHDSAEADQMADLMARYVEGHKDAFAGGGKRLSVATQDDGSFSFDVVDQVSDHNEAQTLASERNVTEIYDVANNKVISTAQGRPRNDGANADTNPNAVESVGNGLDANQPVSGTDGSSDQSQGQPGDGGSSTGEQRAAEPGDQPATGGDSNPDSGAEQQPASTPTDSGARPDGTPGQRVEAVESAPAENYDSGLDAEGLPEDRESLERMVNRMEAKASRMQDDPAVEAVEAQLDTIYKKLARLDNQDAPADNQKNEDSKAPEAAPTDSADAPVERAVEAPEASAPAEATPRESKPADVPEVETPDQAPETEDVADKPAPDLSAQAQALRERVARASDTPPVAPTVQEPLAAPENADTSTLSQRVKDAEKRVKVARAKVENVYKSYGANDIPNSSQYKSQELKAKADLTAARANLATTRADLDRHLNADPVEAQNRADRWRQAGAPNRTEMPEGFAEGDKVEWGDGNRGTVRRAIVDRNGKTRVTVSKDADQANNALADGNVVNIRPEDLRKVDTSATVEGSNEEGNNNGTEPTAESGGQAGVSDGVGSDGGSDNGSGDSGSDIQGTPLESTERTDALAEQGVHVPEMFEIESSPENAQRFHDAIDQVRQSSTYGAAVYVYEPGEYQDMRMFMNSDGTAGFALHGDEIVSVFVQPGSKDKGGARAMLAQAVAQGGTHLDAFDTVLPKLYAKEGFVPVARTGWNDEYAPEGWDKSTFGAYNNGEPDVVFMAHDPSKVDSDYEPGAGQRVDDYDEGVRMATEFGNSPQTAENTTSNPGTPDAGENVSDAPTAPPVQALPEITPVQSRSLGGGNDNSTQYVTPTGQNYGSTTRALDGSYRAFDPSDRSTGTFPTQEDAETWLGDRIARRAGVSTNPLTNEPVSDAEPNGSVYSGSSSNPVSTSRVRRLENVAAGKDLTPDQQDRIDALINSDDTLSGQVNDMLQELSETPNRPNTITRPRENNPVNFTTTSPELTEVDPGKIADPNRIMRDLKENHEGYEMLANGDIVIESRNENGNTYDLVVRRTASERFFPYIRETNNDTGISRALRVGDETHSYKALTTKLNRAKDDIRKDGIARRFNRKRGLENLPANGDFDSVPDPVRDFINHTHISRTPDEHTNRMADMLADIAVRGDSDTVLRNLARENDLPDEFVNRIVDAVLAKAQNDQLVKIARDEARRQQEDESARRSWIPFEGDAPLQVNDWVDWTDYREFIDVNKPTQRPNPNYMRVYRGQVRSLRTETNDGNGEYVYSDSTYVVFPEMNSDAGMKASKQRQRISSQLRKVDSESAPMSDPFFAKKEEKQRPENREGIVRDFGERSSVGEGEQIAPLTRSTPGQIVDPEIDVEGVPYLGDADPIALPANGIEATQVFLSRQDVSKFADQLETGDMIVIMPGKEMVLRPATVISNNSQDGQSSIDLGYYDSQDNLVRTTKVVNSSLRFPTRVTDSGAAPSNDSAPESIEEGLNSSPRGLGDHVYSNDIPGNTGVITDISAPDRLGEITYTVRADSNGAEYPRKERYLVDAPSSLDNDDLIIQPVSSAPTGKLAEPATDKQKSYISDLLARKQVSTASRSQITRALTSDDFSKGSASQIITELKNHKDTPTRQPSSEVAGDAAANVAQSVADDLKRDSTSATSGQRVQDAVDAATQERAIAEYTEPTNDREYDGYSVAYPKYSELQAGSSDFTTVENAPNSSVQVGDIFPRGVGEHRYYMQVVGRNGDSFTLRMVTDPGLQYDGEISEGQLDLGRTNTIMRPTKKAADSGYFRQDAAPGDAPTVPNQPATVNNYAAKAQEMLDSYNSGFETKVLPKRGAMNQGVSIVHTQNGDEYFVKKVNAREGEAENEVAASIVAHAIGLTDTTVISPDPGTVVSTNVKGDLAGSINSGDFSFPAIDILNDIENHPNARMIGLLDYLTANEDRHSENWMVVDADTPSGKDAVPIDHGNISWLGGEEEMTDTMADIVFDGNPFVGPVLGDATPYGEGPGLYSKSELIQIRDRILSQRGAFISASPDNGLTYFKAALANINTLIERL